LAAHSRYQARPGPLDVGGDFLDVFPVDDERLGFFIGDASGHDLATVTTMVTARHTLRAAGLHFHRPAQVLRWLDDILRSTAETVFCTAIYGTLTPAADHGIDVVLGNAGHPPPVHVAADGARLVGPHGALLGVFDSFRDPPTVELHLAPGDRLVMFTNGLLESCRPRLVHDELVTSLVGSHVEGHGDPHRILDDLVQRCIDEGGPDRDDMAYLVLTATGGTATPSPA
jgi:sigma-B regulation protein RsbU (phosphoserine phosphatase)